MSTWNTDTIDQMEETAKKEFDHTANKQFKICGH